MQIAEPDCLHPQVMHRPIGVVCAHTLSALRVQYLCTGLDNAEPVLEADGLPRDQCRDLPEAESRHVPNALHHVGAGLLQLLERGQGRDHHRRL